MPTERLGPGHLVTKVHERGSRQHRTKVDNRPERFAVKCHHEVDILQALSYARRGK